MHARCDRVGAKHTEGSGRQMINVPADMSALLFNTRGLIHSMSRAGYCEKCISVCSFPNLWRDMAGRSCGSQAHTSASGNSHGADCRVQPRHRQGFGLCAVLEIKVAGDASPPICGMREEKWHSNHTDDDDNDDDDDDDDNDDHHVNVNAFFECFLRRSCSARWAAAWQGANKWRASRTRLAYLEVVNGLLFEVQLIQGLFQRACQVVTLLLVGAQLLVLLEELLLQNLGIAQGAC
jgi:hypothetical protein